MSTLVSLLLGAIASILQVNTTIPKVEEAQQVQIEHCVERTTVSSTYFIINQNEQTSQKTNQ